LIYKRVSLKDLTQKHASFIDWTDFINQILKAYDSQEVLRDDDVIIIMGLEYFEKLTKIINEYNASPEKEKTLKIFALFYLIRFSLPLLSKDYRDQFNELGIALTGSEKFERWQVCVDQTDSIFGMGYAVSRLFIRDQPNNSKQAAKDLIKSVKSSFVKNFVNIPWMNKKTRLLAEKKVKSVDDLIGYPDFIENDQLLNIM
jgi:predicted metalloendopeptidase